MPSRSITGAARGIALGVIVAVGGCSRTAPQPAPISEVVLASTTSTQDSGLFDVLIPAFEQAHPGFRIKVIAVGTGEALKLGQLKDADVLLVHAKADEEKFVATRFGRERRDVMYNDFVIVGPDGDPAGVKKSPNAAAAMVAIQEAARTGKTLFVSRGDDSGTHKKELALWRATKLAVPVPRTDAWYLSTGQGMGETLNVATEKKAYTLTDRATYLSLKGALELAIVLEKDPGLRNQYGVITVAGSRNETGGQAFLSWIVSPAGQRVIASFGVAKHGQQLFVPNAK